MIHIDQSNWLGVTIPAASSARSIGSILGGIGSLVGSLFGSKTSIVGNGLFGGAQSLGSILNGGFDASYYSDIQKKKKHPDACKDEYGRLRVGDRFPVVGQVAVTGDRRAAGQHGRSQKDSEQRTRSARGVDHEGAR